MAGTRCLFLAAIILSYSAKYDTIRRPETSQYIIHNTIPSAEDLSNFELLSVVSNPVDKQKKLGEITNIGTIEIAVNNNKTVN